MILDQIVYGKDYCCKRLLNNYSMEYIYVDKMNVDRFKYIIKY